MLATRLLGIVFKPTGMQSGRNRTFFAIGCGAADECFIRQSIVFFSQLQRKPLQPLRHMGGRTRIKRIIDLYWSIRYFYSLGGFGFAATALFNSGERAYQQGHRCHRRWKGEESAGDVFIQSQSARRAGEG